MEKEKELTFIDEEEKELIESIERDEWVRSKEEEKEKKYAKEAAEGTVRKNKRMNIRISERDLRSLKIRALEEGLPYQTLVSMIIHKYLSGKLKEDTSGEKHNLTGNTT